MTGSIVRIFAFFSLIIILCEACFSENTQIVPDSLRCNDQINPVGIHSPYFGWLFHDADDNEIQTAYQILVASSLDNLNENNADIWNSEKVFSSSQNYICFNGDNLESDKQYFWKVRTWDKDGTASTYSQSAIFTTGLLNNSDWSGASWINRISNTNEEYTWFRKSFDLSEKELIKATIYISAAHDYFLYLDGKYIGTGPGYHYPEYQYYNAYDITDNVNGATDHVFGCLTHWYGSGQGRPKSSNGLLVKAIFEFSDSTKLIVGSDSTWKIKQNQAFKTGQSARNGEGIGYIDYIDSRYYEEDWNTLSYDDSDWQNANVIGAHPTDPWTGNLTPNYNKIVHDTIKPISVTSEGDGTYIIDLGKIYAGVPHITFTGADEGNVIDILGGYTLTSSGKVSTETDQGTDMSYSYVLNSETNVFEPIIYLGMRYIQVDNSPVELNSQNVNFITRQSDIDTTLSYFKSSNEMLNKVYNLMRRSIILGAQESFVDTPTREKGGFLGDSWSTGASAMSIFGERLMNLRVLEQFRQSQDQYWLDGRMNAVYPNGDGQRDIPDYTQMFLFWVWDYYMQTGNKQFLIDNYDQIKKVADYVNNYTDSETGLIHNLEGGSSAYKYGIIDWPKDMRYNYDVSTESRTVMNAYAYYDFKIMGLIANELDSTEVAENYQSLAENMTNAINDELISSDSVYIDGINNDGSMSSHASQHANMLPMALGIVPDENKQAVIDLIKEKEMSVGMVTIKWLPQAIGEAEEGIHLVELYTNTDWDGWAKIISLGGTATWESWNANTNDESMSHPWGTVGILGIQEYVLGVKPLLPQHELIQIKPLWFADSLLNAEGAIPTDRGIINISWTNSTENQAYTMNFIIPDNMQAEVYIPKADNENNEAVVNDETIEGEFIGDYLYLGTMGSGTYTITRETGNSQTISQVSSSQEQKFKLYPNPAKDKFCVNLDKTYKKIKIQINDLSGRTIQKNNFYNTTFCEVNLKSDINSKILLVTIKPDKEQEETYRLANIIK